MDELGKSLFRLSLLWTKLLCDAGLVIIKAIAPPAEDVKERRRDNSGRAIRQLERQFADPRNFR